MKGYFSCGHDSFSPLFCINKINIQVWKECKSQNRILSVYLVLTLHAPTHIVKHTQIVWVCWRLKGELINYFCKKLQLSYLAWCWMRICI